jgi:hypothetical protein
LCYRWIWSNGAGGGGEFEFGFGSRVFPETNFSERSFAEDLLSDPAWAELTAEGEFLPGSVFMIVFRWVRGWSLLRMWLLRSLAAREFVSVSLCPYAGARGVQLFEATTL